MKRGVKMISLISIVGLLLFSRVAIADTLVSDTIKNDVILTFEAEETASTTEESSPPVTKEPVVTTGHNNQSKILPKTGEALTSMLIILMGLWILIALCCLSAIRKMKSEQTIG